MPQRYKTYRINAEMPLLITTEYQTLRTPICRTLAEPQCQETEYPQSGHIDGHGHLRMAGSWNKPEVVLYTPLVKHQNAITLKKSAAMPTTSASLEKILTIAVEIISLDKIIPPMNKNTTDIHMENRYPFSARSCCFAPIFCPTIVAVAEPMALRVA